MRDETVSNGGLSSIPHSTLSGRSDLAIDDVLIISCDRYGPWNGRDTDRPDHVWADLPMVTGVPMLVYCEREPVVRADSYQFGSVEFVQPELDLRERVNVLVETVRDVWRSLTIDRRLALGFGTLHVARHVWRRMRRRPLSPHLARMQVARRVIADELRRRSPRVVLFHGEFDQWGVAVAQACRNAGVIPIAVQHGPIAGTADQYQRLEKLRGHIASGLLCASDNEVDKWGHLPVPVALLGSRRVRWNLVGDDRDSTANSDVGSRPLLVLPSRDSELWRRAVASHSKVEVDVKPHPLHRDGWDLDNVRVIDGELNGVLPNYEVVITGSPNAQIALAMLDKPYIRVRSSDSGDWESPEDAPVFDCLDDVLDHCSTPGDLRRAMARHVPRSHIPPDVDDGMLIDALRSLFDRIGPKGVSSA